MDFERARFNMIEQQVRPWDVLDQDVLDLFMTVRRENFVPPAYRMMAFSDLEVPLNLDGTATGESMLSPKVEARLLQALRIRGHETAIEVGTGSGFMAALLARQARSVTSLELNPALVAFARQNLADNGVRNCEVVMRDGAELIDDAATLVDVILLSGSVPILPAALINRLNPGGRLLAIVGEAPVMSAELVTLSPERHVVRTRLFETLAKPLSGFPAPDRFSF